MPYTKTGLARLLGKYLKDPQFGETIIQDVTGGAVKHIYRLYGDQVILEVQFCFGQEYYPVFIQDDKLCYRPSPFSAPKEITANDQIFHLRAKRI